MVADCARVVDELSSRYTFWRRRCANLETSSPHIRLMFLASLLQGSVGPARATLLW